MHCGHRLAATRATRATSPTETGEPERAQWIANLDEIAALDPTFVVAGHKKVDNNNDPKIIGESQQYLREFSRIAAEEATAAGTVARMVERYPDWDNGRTLWHSARSAIFAFSQRMRGDPPTFGGPIVGDQKIRWLSEHQRNVLKIISHE